MRGSRLFNELFAEETVAVAPRQRAGRNPDLHARRNEAIADRFYFYSTFTALRYEAIIKMLAEDFFLSTVTIPEIITAQVAYIQTLKKAQTPVKELARKWSRFSWQLS